MNFNDGFNERMNYIHNSNNIREKKHSFDNSFAKMRVEERRNLVTTTNNDKTIIAKDIRGNKDNFVIQNNALNNIGRKPLQNDPVRDALNRNRFKK